MIGDIVPSLLDGLVDLGTGWGTGLTNWTYYGHIMIWMQQSYCKEVRHATTSQTGCLPASPELAMAGRRLEPCIMSLSGELSAKR